MDFNQIMAELARKIQQPLPAEEAHVLMSPPFRYPPQSELPPTEKIRYSAVLILLYEKNGLIYTVFMKRSEDNSRHSGQISFPGGGVEAHDHDRKHTALRETEEEFGVPQKAVCVIGNLSDLYIPVSNSLVTPIVGYLTSPPTFVPDPKEVSRIIEVPITHLADKSNTKRGYVSSSAGYRFEVPYFDIEGDMVWGATAMIMSEFLAVWPVQ